MTDWVTGRDWSHSEEKLTRGMKYFPENIRMSCTLPTRYLDAGWPGGGGRGGRLSIAHTHTHTHTYIHRQALAVGPGHQVGCLLLTRGVRPSRTHGVVCDWFPPRPSRAVSELSELLASPNSDITSQCRPDGRSSTASHAGTS